MCDTNTGCTARGDGLSLEIWDLENRGLWRKQRHCSASRCTFVFSILKKLILSWPSSNVFDIYEVNLSKYFRLLLIVIKCCFFVCFFSELMQIGDSTRQDRFPSGGTPISCELCGRHFTRKFSLSQHMRRHTGERPFSCQTCGKSFARLSTLKTHQLVHLQSILAD